MLSILHGAQDTQALPPPGMQGAQGCIQLAAPCPAPLLDLTHRSWDPKGSGTADRGRWPRAGALEAWEARERWPWACWSPASPEWKLLPAAGSGHRWAPEALHMAQAGRTGWGHPHEMPCARRMWMLLCTHTVGDSPTAWPSPVPPRPYAGAGTSHLPSLCFPETLPARETPALPSQREALNSCLSTPGQMESG